MDLDLKVADGNTKLCDLWAQIRDDHCTSDEQAVFPAAEAWIVMTDGVSMGTSLSELWGMASRPGFSASNCIVIEASPSVGSIPHPDGG